MFERFNPDDYNENVDYCEYVFRKNQELDLGLQGASEIQTVANNYAFEMQEITTEEYEENDMVLVNVVKNFVKSYRPEAAEEPSSELIDIKLQFEKLRNSAGGHAYDESYDDRSIEDINQGPKL